MKMRRIVVLSVAVSFLVCWAAGIHAIEKNEITRDDETGLLKGAGEDIDAAVANALEWLSKTQEPDGRWDGAKHEGRGSNAAITGLALLAFIGAGQTEEDGKYRETIAKAVTWIISQQDAQGAIGAQFAGSLGYRHGICGLALCEAYGTSGNKDTRKAAQRAVDYSVNIHQAPNSGWRYKPRQEADTSVTGWFIMQLASAKEAKLKVPAKSLRAASNFLDQVTYNTGTPGGVGYMPKKRAGHTTTASAMNARMLMGMKPKNLLMLFGAKYVLQELPRWPQEHKGVNFYYWFFGTKALHKVGGKYWQSWDEPLRKTLLENQRRNGDAKGSWDPVGVWCVRGGRIYSTAMAALTLEVYYQESAK